MALLVVVDVDVHVLVDVNGFLKENSLKKHESERLLSLIREPKISEIHVIRGVFFLVLERQWRQLVQAAAPGQELVSRIRRDVKDAVDTGLL